MNLPHTDFFPYLLLYITTSQAHSFVFFFIFLSKKVTTFRKPGRCQFGSESTFLPLKKKTTDTMNQTNRLCDFYIIQN